MQNQIKLPTIKKKKSDKLSFHTKLQVIAVSVLVIWVIGACLINVCVCVLPHNLTYDTLISKSKISRFHRICTCKGIGA